MADYTTYTCRLYIPAKIHKELNNDIKEIFVKANGSTLFFTDFPAGFEGGDLSNYITAFCEVCLIMGNSKYEISDDVELSCEIFKLGQTEKNFSILVTINYPSTKDNFHEMLNFNKLEEKDDFFSFELLGDQTMFAIDK